MTRTFLAPRRWAAAAVLTLCALSAKANPLPDLRQAGDPSLQKGLEKVIGDLGLSQEVARGHLAVSLVDVTEAEHPRMAMLNGDEMLYAASLPKIAILLGTFVEAERGRITLDAKHIDTLTRMIRVSSNEAASEALRWVGGQRLIEILESPRFGFYEPRGKGGLWVGKSYGPDAAYQRDPVRNLSHGATAFQVARFYQMLAANALVNAQLTAQMKDIMSRPGIIHKFVKGLSGIPGLEIFRKSGSWRDTHADSALVEANGRKYIMVGLAHSEQGGDWLVRLAPRLHELVMANAPATTRVSMR